MEYKDSHQGIPLRDDFLRFAKIPKGQLGILYGRDAYTELQKDCGDQANKWSRERTPREKIMRQYGDLALDLKELPNSSDWIHRRLTPSITGLNKQPHYMKWSDLPSKFQEWVKEDNVTSYDEVLRYINESSAELKAKTKTERKDAEFERVLRDIRLWSPGRRRNSEGEYKIELRAHLKSLGYRVDEEFGESNVDLLVNGKHSIETKKDPQLSEYDRLFGQLARHLQHQRNVIALIFDAPSQDRFSNFVALVDKYLNKEESFVEVIKK
ncbi:MAG: hypothetical protein NT179_04030 [Nitrospirae bacterium]|nr:hypothetical protein [Nitrospirota bacterium]